MNKVPYRLLGIVLLVTATALVPRSSAVASDDDVEINDWSTDQPPEASRPVPYPRPTIRDEGKSITYRLDLCLYGARDCGWPAADAFCRTKRFDRADGWEPDNDIGERSPTLIIGDRTICDQKFCDGFKYINCKN